MDSAELMQGLLELAQEVDLPVRVVRRVDGAEHPPASGTFVLRGQPAAVLSEVDPVEVQIDVLASALSLHRAEALESKFLAPALRERLDRCAPD